MPVKCNLQVLIARHKKTSSNYEDAYNNAARARYNHAAPSVVRTLERRVTTAFKRRQKAERAVMACQAARRKKK